MNFELGQAQQALCSFNGDSRKTLSDSPDTERMAWISHSD